MSNKTVEIRRDDAVETVSLRYVPQESIALYEAVDADGEVVALLLAEGVDEPDRFKQRTEAERNAMQVLALDEYYKGFDWEGTIIDE